MAGNIKGVTIEFRGDTTPLEKALRQINRETAKLDQELKKVDRSLKFNPSKVELWRQKQQLLTQKITETSEKLEVLKRAQAQMDARGVDKTSAEYRNLQREIIEAESKLKMFKSQLIQIGQVNFRAVGEQFKEIGGKITEAGQAIEKYSAVAAAGIAGSTKLSLGYTDAIAKMSTISDESQVPVSQLRQELMNLSNQSGKSAAELAEAAYQALSASVETKDVVAFVEEATKLAKAGFLDTADAVDVLTTIINAYGYSAEDAVKIANMLVQTQNDGKTTVNELAQAMGQVIPTASALNIPLEQLSSAYVSLTKQGINTANATTYLNGMFTELADDGSDVSAILRDKTGKSFGQLMDSGMSLGDILGILSNSVDGNGEDFLNLWGNVRAGRGALALLNGGVDEFNAEAETMSNVTDNVGAALEKLDTPGAKARKALNMLVNAGIQIGDVFAPYIEKAAVFIQGLIDKFNALSPSTKNIIAAVMAIIAVAAPLLLMGGKLLSGIGSIIIGVGKVISFVQMLIPIISTIVGVIGGVGVAFLGVAAIIGVAALAIYKHWDQIKAWAIGLANKVSAEWTRIKTNAANQVTAMKNEVTAKWNSLKDFASSIWNAIKDKIVTPIQNAKDKVKAILDKVKDFFPIKVGKLLEGIKLPHFKLSGEFSLKNKKVPKLSVDWYAQGGIFNSPTIAGIGEIPGGEAVVPLNKFWDKLDKMQGGTSIVININGANADPKEIAEEVKRSLIRETNRKRLAWQ